ncbi:MAG: chaperonin GroEL [Clostridia bacterium]
MKQLKFNEEALINLENGVSTLASAVKQTLGPKGRNVIIERKYSTPLITNDGVTIAREIMVDNPFENLGASVLKEASIKTNEVAGDGTTTACVLAEAMIHEGFKQIRLGVSPIILRKGMERATKVCEDMLEHLSCKIISENDIASVASIASGDEEIGKLIASATKKVGREGIIIAEVSGSVETQLLVKEGIQIERGYLSSHFKTNEETGEAVLDEPYILLCDKKINSALEIAPILEQVIRECGSLLIVCDDMDSDALNMLVINKLRGNLKSVAIKSPLFAEKRKQFLADLALLTGATVYSDFSIPLSEFKLSNLGKAKKITATPLSTLILGACSNTEIIDDKVCELVSTLRSTTDNIQKEILSNRLALLNGKIAVIAVGGATEIEMQERKLRIDDALSATRCAISGGVVSGGGIALLKIQDLATHVLEDCSAELQIGINVVLKSLDSPLRQILLNAGEDVSIILANILKNTSPSFGFDALTSTYVNMLEKGILDPCIVTKTALKNASSVAMSLLTTSVIICEKDEK